MTTRIKLRRDTATNWGNANPVLALGEAGYDTTNNALRIGDGTTGWNDLTAIAGGAGGNILLSESESYSLVLGNGGWLMGGEDGYGDIKIGQDYNNDVRRAYLYISQDNPYAELKVASTTSNNYRVELGWDNPWYNRSNKIFTNAYGTHINTAQWNGPGNNYNNLWQFTRDGTLNMPPAAVIRVNDQSLYNNDYNNDEDNPYAGEDSSLTLEANTISVARGRLDMNGTGLLGPNWIAMTGAFDNAPAETWKDGAWIDRDGFVYTLDGADTYGPGGVASVTKWSPTGERLWQRVLTDADNGDNVVESAYMLGIGQDPNSGEIKVAFNHYTAPYDQVYIASINPDTGLQYGQLDQWSSPTKNIEINDFAFTANASAPGYGYIAVGRAANGETYIEPTGMGVIQSGQRLVVDPASFGPGITPSADTQSSWYMFGDGITGNVQINAVNDISNVTATRTSGSGTGTDAVFRVLYTPGGSYSLNTTTPGTNYDDSDVFTVLGTALGGATPANDLTFHVTTNAGAIDTITSVAGTATTNITLGIVGNPVNFNAIATPTLLAYTSTDALLIHSGFFGPVTGATTFGNVSWDTFNAVAEDTITSGTAYVGGRYHPGGGGTDRRSILAKVNGSGIVWTREVDDYHGRNEITGIAVDTTGNVATIAINNNDQTVVTKVSTDGVMLWQRIIVSQTYDTTIGALGIGVDNKNNIIVTTQVNNYSADWGNDDLGVMSFDPDGNMLWSRTLGTPQNDYSWRDRAHRNISVNGDTMTIAGATFAGGFGSTHPGQSQGFVAKLPSDGSAVGHYGEWRYLDATAEIEIVSNTAANAALTFSVTSNNVESTSRDYWQFANLAVTSSGSAPEFPFPAQVYQAGGPGTINGLNSLMFRNGASINNLNEEGLILHQPSDGGHNSEYIGLWYGGNIAETSPNISITAGTDTFGDDDSDLNDYFFPSNGQKQVNIDIVTPGTNGDPATVINWHFDENGNVYLPSQPTFTSSPAVASTGIVFGDGSFQTTSAEGQTTVYLNSATEEFGLQLVPMQMASLIVIEPENGYGGGVNPHNIELAPYGNPGKRIRVLNASSLVVNVTGWPGPPYTLSSYEIIELILISTADGTYWWVSSSFSW